MTRLLSIALCGGLLLAGCAASEIDEEAGPVVVGLSKAEVVVGEQLEVYGKNFLPADQGITRVIFEGTFVTDDGDRESVGLSFEALFDGEIVRDGETWQVLRLSRFGPFRNPFSGRDRPGVFRGTIRAVTEDQHGVITRQTDGRDFELAVGPSIIIEELQPLDAQCGAPALRALAGIPYRLRVKATGIKATRFVYRLSRINDAEGVVELEHAFEQPVGEDVLGEDEAIIFNPVRPDEQFYLSEVRVLAYDKDGNVVETGLPLSVHRPIEVVYEGKRELAERYEPVPVSGCIPGSIGTSVSYSETRREVRQKTVSVTVARTFTQSQGQSRSAEWQKGISEGESRSRSFSTTDSEEERVSEGYGVTYSQSQSNNVSFSTTDGETWGWSLSEGESNTDYASRMNRVFGEGSWSGTVGVEAEGSIPGFAKVTGSASTTVGVRAGAATSGTEGQSRTQSSNRGFSMSGSHSETRGFGSTTTEAQSQSINGAYAVARGTSRTLSEGETLENTHTWNLGEGVSESEVISDSQEVARALTLEDSEEHEVGLGFNSYLPRNKVGIFYRQTTRWVRRAEVRAYNLCGIAKHLGELQFNEWTWAPDFAIGNSCDEGPPPSKLDPAACFIEPCGG